MSLRTAAGHRWAARAAQDTARGDATSPRKARFIRHFDRNASCRARASAAGASRTCPSSSCDRDRGGELGATQREVQAVAGHRVDESGGIARQQQAGHACGRRVDRERTEHAGSRDEPRTREARASSRIAPQRCHRASAAGSRKRAAPRLRHDDAGVGEPSGHGRDADVVSAADVHFAEPGRRGHIVEVAADRPAARARRVVRDAELERKPGVASIRGDGQRPLDRRARAPPLLTTRTPVTRGRPSLTWTSGSWTSTPGSNETPGLHCVLNEHPVEVAAEQ